MVQIGATDYLLITQKIHAHLVVVLMNWNHAKIAQNLSIQHWLEVLKALEMVAWLKVRDIEFVGQMVDCPHLGEDFLRRGVCWWLAPGIPLGACGTHMGNRVSDLSDV